MRQMRSGSEQQWRRIRPLSATAGQGAGELDQGDAVAVRPGVGVVAAALVIAGAGGQEAGVVVGGEGHIQAVHLQRAADQLPQLNQYRRYVRYSGYYNGVMYSAYSREKLRRAPNRRSGGGRVSFGGGGGFSGGGSGGIR